MVKNPPGASHVGGVLERLIQIVISILAVLSKIHGCSLNDQRLITLVAETERIINSRPQTVEFLSDVSSEIQLSSVSTRFQCLIPMKSDVTIPPSGVFNRPELY